MRFLSAPLLGSVLLAGFVLPSPAAAGPPPAAVAASVPPATGSPEWIVDRFFAQKEFPEIARYSTGEFAQLYNESPTLGSIVPPSVTVQVRPLERTASSAAFGVSMTDGNVTKEWYAYLRDEGAGFKLEAIRTLALSGKFLGNLVEMEKAAVAGRLAEAGAQELDRLHLIIASDSALKTHFTAQQALFEALAKEFAALAALDSVSAFGEVTPAKAAAPEQVASLAQQLRALRLGTAIRKFRDCEGCLVLKVGGEGESQVGYLFAPAGAQVPKMSPQSFIYLEPIVPGWFLFKTV
jgi:hypothetical protein